MSIFKFTPIALVLFLLAFATNASAQQDSTESDDVVLNTNKVKVIIKEKKKVIKTVDGRDSVISEGVERVEIINKDTGEPIEVETAENAVKIIKLKEIMSDIEELEDMTNMHEDFEEERKIPLVETDWFNMQIGFNNLLNADDKLEMPTGSEDLELVGTSTNFQLHIIQQALNIYKGKVRLVYGLGVDYNNYKFVKNVDITKDVTPIETTIHPDRDYKKNKLVTQYLTAPLLLDLELGKTRGDGFKIAFGPNFGYLIGSHQKQKWEGPNGKSKVKLKDDFNLEKFRMGLEAQFGYGNFIVYGRYFPNSIFTQGGGPDLRTVSAGILIGHI